jgi:hypothetical protein
MGSKGSKKIYKIKAERTSGDVYLFIYVSQRFGLVLFVTYRSQEVCAEGTFNNDNKQVKQNRSRVLNVTKN